MESSPRRNKFRDSAQGRPLWAAFFIRAEGLIPRRSASAFVDFPNAVRLLLLEVRVERFLRDFRDFKPLVFFEQISVERKPPRIRGKIERAVFVEKPYAEIRERAPIAVQVEVGATLF